MLKLIRRIWAQFKLESDFDNFMRAIIREGIPSFGGCDEWTEAMAASNSDVYKSLKAMMRAYMQVVEENYPLAYYNLHRMVILRGFLFATNQITHEKMISTYGCSDISQIMALADKEDIHYKLYTFMVQIINIFNNTWERELIVKLEDLSMTDIKFIMITNEILNDHYNKYNDNPNKEHTNNE